MFNEESFQNTKLLNLFNFGICIIDENLTIKYCNDWLTNHAKTSQDEIVNKNLNELFPILDSKELNKQLSKVYKNKEQYYYEPKQGYLFQIENCCENTISKYIQQGITLYPLEDKNILITIEDKTALIEANKKVKRLSILFEEQKQLLTDKLTNLPNRNCLLQYISEHKNKKLAILNIDGFGEINDFYGHEVGDKYLVNIANRLNEELKDSPIQLFKLPSDEYGIICSEDDNISNSEFENIIKTIISNLNSTFYEDEENKIAIFINAGISFVDEMILRTCDIAVKNSRKTKKELVIYDATLSIEKKVEETHKWLDELKDAIENNRMKAFFQPIYNIKKERIEKYETLIRLIDRNDKVVSPFFFLDVSKRAKLYNEITACVIEQSFKIFKNTDYEFSLNISVEDIEHQPTVDLLLKSLKENPDVANRVVIELLEDEGIENFDLVKGFIDSVKEYGAKVAIDDFGTGYSNFSYLLELNVDYLKIDASLIKNIHKDENSKKIVETLVDFGKKINAKTIAEFVHNQEVLDEITKLDIDYAQGFFVDAPRAEIGGDPVWKE